MLLCLDVGNTHIVGGVFKGEQLIAPFRYVTEQIGTADQFGLFLLHFLKENNIDRNNIDAFSVSSVVQKVNFALNKTVSIYFPKAKYFMLSSATQTHLKIHYKDPSKLGADLIAGAIGASSIFPKRNLVIVDLGTCTTIVAIKHGTDYMGGSYLPGLKTSMQGLVDNTSGLMQVDIQKPTSIMGQTTEACLQSGLYYGHLGAMREIITKYKENFFEKEESTVVVTGGFVNLFKGQNIFDHVVPDLILQGLRIAYTKAENDSFLQLQPMRNLFKKTTMFTDGTVS